MLERSAVDGFDRSLSRVNGTVESFGLVFGVHPGDEDIREGVSFERFTIRVLQLLE
jgi:hypothetical protein